MPIISFPFDGFQLCDLNLNHYNKEQLVEDNRCKGKSAPSVTMNELNNQPQHIRVIKDKIAKNCVREESLKHLGLSNVGHVYWDLHTAALYEEVHRRHEGSLSHLGPIVLRTGPHTGRLLKDTFLVREPA